VRPRINTEPAFDPMTLFTSERPAVATPNSQAVPERRPPMFVAVPDRYPLRGPRISSTAARVTVITTSAMVVGVLIGFASGYLTSPGFNVPGATVPGATVPRATTPHAAVPQATVPQATVPQATVPQAAPPAAPATLNPSPSQISATAVNPPSSKANTGGPLSAAPVREPRVPAAAAAITRPQGSIVVVSRPPGADVALDGRVVGQTPMSIPNVTEGMHVLGIELPGFSRWATTVRVEAGEPTRVGASLTP
jgi:hypothetical protein